MKQPGKNHVRRATRYRPSRWPTAAAVSLIALWWPAAWWPAAWWPAAWWPAAVRPLRAADPPASHPGLGSVMGSSVVGAPRPAGAPRPVGAPAWILMDVETGRALAEHNARRRMFPASTTKTMTALVAIESGKLDQIVRVGPNPAQTGERSSLLMQGEKFVLRDLLRAALIRSSNDACVAVAEGVAGSLPAFVRMMNDKARELGARDTHFVNPHGLHDPRHYSTARDLAIIARAAMRHRFFNQTVRTREATIHGNYKIGPQRLLVNTNRLLRRWTECDGVKTGYTKQAGRCLIASATRRVNSPSGVAPSGAMASGAIASGATQPFRLLCVVLHSPDTWSDAWALLQKQGFERFHPVAVTGAGEEFGVANVAGGAFSARAVTPRAVQMPLRDDERMSLSRRVHLLPLKAPVKSGQAIGRIEFLAQGRTLVEVPLLAREAVPVSLVARLMPPVARVMPSNPSLRWGIYGSASLALALLLSALKIRAAQGGSSRAGRRPVRVARGVAAQNSGEGSRGNHGRTQITPGAGAHNPGALGIGPQAGPSNGEPDRTPDAARRRRGAITRRAQTEEVRARVEAWQSERERRQRAASERRRDTGRG